jgi:hypothetical protein
MSSKETDDEDMRAEGKVGEEIGKAEDKSGSKSHKLEPEELVRKVRACLYFHAHHRTLMSSHPALV